MLKQAVEAGEHRRVRLEKLLVQLPQLRAQINLLVKHLGRLQVAKVVQDAAVTPRAGLALEGRRGARTILRCSKQDRARDVRRQALQLRYQ